MIFKPQLGCQSRLGPFDRLGLWQRICAGPAGLRNPQSLTDQIRCFFRHQPIGGELSPANRDKIIKAVCGMIQQRKPPADTAIITGGLRADQWPDAGIGPDVSRRLQNRNHRGSFTDDGIHFLDRRVNVVQVVDADRSRSEDGNRAPRNQNICVCRGTQAVYHAPGDPVVGDQKTALRINNIDANTG